MKFQVKSDIAINADIEKVKDHIIDFNKWSAWSPWSICEPDHKVTIKGDKGSVGHEMSWDGEIIGSGTNTIEEIEGNSIKYNLEFHKPWKSHSKTAFHLEKTSDGTKVTWTMDSSMPFFLFFMVKPMKSWIEMDYERGLSMLKSMIETGEVPAKTTNEGVIDFEGFNYVGIKRTTHYKNMPKDMSEDFNKIMKKLESEGRTAKHWFCLYPKVDMGNKMFTYIAAASAENLLDTEFSGEFIKGEIKTTKALEVKHHGSYRFLGNAWSMGMMYFRAKKMKRNGNPFEYYWNNPSNTDEKDLKTSIYFPSK